MSETEIFADSVVVLDFETTGLSPYQGDRPIEIGAIRLENGVITDRFQELMNPGFRINSFIESYTGITNGMLKKAAPCSEVMARFGEFIGNDKLVAHNASFDSKFLNVELSQLQGAFVGDFACSMLVARRIYPMVFNHKLATLIRYKKIPIKGDFHRALADAEMTAHLWLRILDDIRQDYGFSNIPFSLMKKLGKKPKKSVHQFLLKQAAS